MLIVMRDRCSPQDVDRVVDRLREMSLDVRIASLAGRTVIGVEPPGFPRGADVLEGLAGVDRTVLLSDPHPLARADVRGTRTVIEVGEVRIGAGRPVLIAGPCAVEDESELCELAVVLRSAGADLLRGGAFKPRSSPYSFQGVGVEGYRWLARAREVSGLPVISEVLDETSLAAATEHVDVLQVGARNMHNFELLKKVARAGRPVLLKRGLTATLEELLLAAEYLLDAGNPRVLLCERGIRTFSGHSRFTLDLSIVPAIRESTHLPVIVDPSHATGFRSRVPAMARAALAAGADGVMLEVHGDPRRALSDGRQALRPAQFAALAAELRALATAIGSVREPV